jgi:serine/threonine-protein kinase RsbW
VSGNRGDEARRVTRELDVDGDGLEIRVRDQGPGFDPSRVPDPLALENLCRSSGRGILLMKALMDAVTFCRPRGGGMEVRMRKSRPRTVESTITSGPREAEGV